MKYPMIQIPPRNRKVIFIFLLLSTFLAMLVLYLTGRPLITDAAPGGIISYELAGNVETAQKILDSWDPTAKIYAGYNIGFDYLFLLLYSATIALAITWLSDLLKLGPTVKRLAKFLAMSMTIAALLDGTENAALFYMLVRGVTSPWPQIAVICASIKFGLVFLGLVFIVIGYVAYLWRSTTQPAE